MLSNRSFPQQTFWLVIARKVQVFLITLTAALFYSTCPNKKWQHDSESAWTISGPWKLNAIQSFILIIYNCAFHTVTWKKFFCEQRLCLFCTNFNGKLHINDDNLSDHMGATFVLLCVLTWSFAPTRLLIIFPTFGMISAICILPEHVLVLIIQIWYSCIKHIQPERFPIVVQAICSMVETSVE